MDINMLSNCSWFIQISNIELKFKVMVTFMPIFQNKRMMKTVKTIDMDGLHLFGLATMDKKMMSNYL